MMALKTMTVQFDEYDPRRLDSAGAAEELAKWPSSVARNGSSPLTLPSLGRVISKCGVKCSVLCGMELGRASV